MRRICVDENLSPVVAKCLDELTNHRIQHVHAISGAAGVEDVALFAQLATLGFDGLITLDRMQLVNAIEREALRSSGLVWIGLPPGNLPGLKGS